MQIVGYDTAGAADAEAALLVAREGVVEREPLPPERELEFALGERRCAGATEGREHVACDSPAAPYCEAHTSRWVCARCTGNCSKPTAACHEEHAVYLAAFAPDTFKVGVTKSHRLATRLREQGADRGAHLYTVADGRIAREVEADLAGEFPDRVRVPTKIDGVHLSVDEAAWTDALRAFDAKDTLAFDYGLGLRDRPVRETLASGTVRGTKGRVLVLDRPGGTYAVDMRDLVGYEVDAGGPARELQSSLGSFG